MQDLEHAKEMINHLFELSPKDFKYVENHPSFYAMMHWLFPNLEACEDYTEFKHEEARIEVIDAINADDLSRDIYIDDDQYNEVTAEIEKLLDDRYYVSEDQINGCNLIFNL